MEARPGREYVLVRHRGGIAFLGRWRFRTAYPMHSTFRTEWISKYRFSAAKLGVIVIYYSWSDWR